MDQWCHRQSAGVKCFYFLEIPSCAPALSHHYIKDSAEIAFFLDTGPQVPHNGVGRISKKKGAKMPECFQVWLEHLSQDDAKAMWEYFDGSFTNCEDVIFTICGSHPLLVLGCMVEGKRWRNEDPTNG
jgi:hypothetical protein